MLIQQDNTDVAEQIEVPSGPLGYAAWLVQEYIALIIPHYLFNGQILESTSLRPLEHPGTIRFVFTNFTKTYTTLVQM